MLGSPTTARTPERSFSSVAGIEPVVDTVDYLLVTTGTASVQDLEAEDDIWIRADKGDADIGVIRGPAKIVLAAKP